MILYRKEPYPLQMKNIMLLDDIKSGGVVYVNKETYDQALMLYSRFDGDYKRVINTINCKKTEAYVATPGLPKLIDNMATSMPAPINILAPFLIYCTQNQGIEWNSEDREMAYGILHQYSQMINFDAITQVPAEVRLQVSFPTTLLKQYKTSWDDLCSTLKDTVVMGSLTQPVQPTPVVAPTVQPTPTATSVTPTPQPAVPVTPTPQPTAPTPTAPAEPEKPVDEFEQKMKALAEKMKNDRAKHEEDMKKKKVATPTPASAPKTTAPTSTGANDAKECNSILDEFDDIE